MIDRRWHRISAAFPPVTAFTISMLIATFLHWDRFDITHFPFQVWLVLYIITPFLVPFLWLRNRAADPGTPEAQDAVLPGFARLGMAGFGALGLLMTFFMFAFPQSAILIWPWKLTPLTASVLGGWFSLLGVGGLSIARETRWSAWRVALQSFMLWAALVLVGALINATDFAPAGAINPFTVGTFLSILSMLAFHLYMDSRARRSQPA